MYLISSGILISTVSEEYLLNIYLFKGLNDTPAHIKELARILNGIKCRINIIRFHKIPGSEFQSPGHG